MYNRYRIHTSIIVIVLSLLTLFGCLNQKPKEYIQLRGFTQGTTYNIIYHHPQNINFANEIELLLARIDSSMSLYNDQSYITAFNISREGVTIDPLLARVVELSLHYNQETNGAFDVTVGPLVRTWGFYGKKGEIPDSIEVQALRVLTGLGMISLQDGFLSKVHPEVMIDVNAIAQGYTVDQISELFEANKVKNYLVEVGGEVRTLGRSPRNDNWIIGVDKPKDDAITGENLQVKISLSGQSLVTSGNYRKFYIRDGVKYSHTIDPKTGYPVNHSLLSATVLSSTSARADALATAFMVMGLEKTQQWLLNSTAGDEVYLVFSDSLGDFKVWMTEGIKKRIVD